MAVPGFQEIMLPLLQILSENGIYSIGELRRQLVEKLGLSDADVNELLPSGRQTRFSNRFSWASIYLRRTGLIENAEGRKLKITRRGQEALRQAPPRIDLKFLSQYPELAEFRQGSRRTTVIADTGQVDETDSTPEELMDSNYQKLRSALSAELLERVKNCSASFFEQLVVDLLLAMGYGGSRRAAGKAFQTSGDDGIDGTIDEDKLGLDIIYIQAKKWSNTPVDRPTVQAFAGSLEGQRARKGVFITTSRFTPAAKEYVSRIEKKIILIDGERLAQLMIDYNVGVAERSIFVVKRMDEDYFSGE